MFFYNFLSASFCDSFVIEFIFVDVCIFWAENAETFVNPLQKLAKKIGSVRSDSKSINIIILYRIW